MQKNSENKRRLPELPIQRNRSRNAVLQLHFNHKTYEKMSCKAMYKIQKGHTDKADG